MIEQKDGILIHFFSGYHIGAEILVPTGKHLFGTDDSCDFILMDKGLANHHFILEVTQNPDTITTTDRSEADNKNYTVTISPLENNIFINENKIADDTLWEEGQLLRTAMLSLAWASHDMMKVMENVYQNLYKNPEKVFLSEDGTNTEKEEIASHQEQNEILTLNPEKENNADNVVLNKLHNKKQQNLPKRKNYVALFFAVLTICALFFTFTPIEENKFKNIENIQQYLDDNDFAHISVMLKDNEVIWQGIIENDTERAKLHSLAQKMLFPVYLDLIVKTDLANTFKQIFATNNLYPTVLIDKEKIYLGYYVKDALIKQLTHNSLKELLPQYAELKEKIVEKTIYAEQLRACINLKEADFNLNNLDPIFEEGKISFNTLHQFEKQKDIQQLMHSIEEDLGFFIKCDFISVKSEKTESSQAAVQFASNKTAAGSKVPTQASIQKNDFTVTSVSMGAIPFITLSNNEKVFKGGTLPNGGTLEHITINELTINHNGSITIYPLRGN